jgi:hypothetical protein
MGSHFACPRLEQSSVTLENGALVLGGLPSANGLRLWSAHTAKRNKPTTPTGCIRDGLMVWGSESLYFIGFHCLDVPSS